MRGPEFFSLHNAFEEQYNELFSAVDEIAERIRAKGALAPGGLSNLAKMAGIEEIAEDSTAEEMVLHLAEANEQLLKDLKAASKWAAEIGDSETEDRTHSSARKDRLDAKELLGLIEKLTRI